MQLSVLSQRNAVSKREMSKGIEKRRQKAVRWRLARRIMTLAYWRLSTEDYSLLQDWLNTHSERKTAEAHALSRPGLQYRRDCILDALRRLIVDDPTCMRILWDEDAGMDLRYCDLDSWGKEVVA